MTTKIEVLNACTNKGNVIYLPTGQLERKLYQEVASALSLIGGKWKAGKIMGFEFLEDPAFMLQELRNGGSINLKKEYQFFATPTELANEMVRMADIKNSDCILEPSAGQGAIIDAVLRYTDANILNVSIHYIEKMELNRSILLKKYGMAFPNVDMVCPDENDFLNLIDFYNFEGYDKIIANPPFSKNQDIDHIRKMYACLKPGGKIVTISSKHWVNSSNKKEKDFAAWLYEECDANINGINAGVFSESGTKVETLIIEINKP